MRGIQIFVIDGLDRIELKLPQGFTAQFEQISPIVDFNGIPGSYSTDLTIPVEGNELALRGVHHTDSADGDWIYNIEFFDAGAFIFEGKMIVENSLSNSNDDNYDITIIRGDFASSIADLNLRDVIDEELVLSETIDFYTPMKTANAGSWPDFPFCFPMYRNPEHFGGANEFFGGLVNPYSQSVQLFQQQSELEPGQNAFENEFTYSPWLYLFYALEKVLDYTGYRAKGNWYTSSLSKKICIVSNYSMDRFRDTERINIRRSADVTLLASTFLPYNEVLFNSTGNTITSTNHYTIGKRGVHKVVIQLNMGTFTGALTVHFKTGGISGFGTQWSVVGQNQLHILEAELSVPDAEVGNVLSVFVQGSNMQVLEGTALFVHNVTESTGLQIENSFQSRNLVPDISVSQFMVAIRALGLKIEVDDTTKEISFDYQTAFLEEANVVDLGLSSKETPTEHEERNAFEVSMIDAEELPNLDRYIGEFDTLEDLQNSGGYATESVALVKQLGAYMIFQVNETFDDFEWQFLQKEAAFQNLGQGKRVTVDIPFKIPRCTMSTFVGEEALVPELESKASGKSFGMKIEKGELTLCYYHGLRNGSVGLYPFASPFSIDYQGNTIASQSLSLVQEDGFYKQLWEPVLEVLQQNRLIEKQVFDRNEWTSAPFDFRIRYANNEWIVAEITEIMGKETSPITVQLKKI